MEYCSLRLHSSVKAYNARTIRMATAPLNRGVLRSGEGYKQTAVGFLSTPLP